MNQHPLEDLLLVWGPVLLFLAAAPYLMYLTVVTE